MKEYFSRLDILRFLAFFLVFINHLTKFLHFPASVDLQGSVAFTYLQVGDLGVGFFFVLSGFLITYLLEKERETDGSISLKNFYLRRALRIWPLYFLGILIAVLLSFSFKDFHLYKIFIDPHEILSHLFFVGNLFKAFWHTSNEMIAVFWSIAVEEQFYLVWPILFIIFRKNISWLLALGIIISMSVRYHFANDFEAREFFTLSVMIYLMIGSLAGLHGKKLKDWIQKRPWKLAGFSFVGFIIVLSIRGLFDYAYPPWFIAIDGLLFGLFFAVIVLAFAYGRIGRKSSWEKILEYLGRISYGLYVYHLISLTIIIYLLERLGFNDHVWTISEFFLVGFFALALTIIISTVSYKCFEKPFLRLKEKFIHL